MTSRHAKCGSSLALFFPQGRLIRSLPCETSGKCLNSNLRVTFGKKCVLADNGRFPFVRTDYQYWLVPEWNVSVPPK